MTTIKSSNGSILLDYEGANLEGANLEGAYLRGANLRGANLEGANLWGEGRPLLTKETKIIQITGLFYNVLTDMNTIKIGCKTYSREDWSKFSDDEIRDMDGQQALSFWKENKDKILSFTAK